MQFDWAVDKLSAKTKSDTFFWTADMVVRKLGRPNNRNRWIMNVIADWNTLIDVFDQHLNKNFRLRPVFLQEITGNTSFT